MKRAPAALLVFALLIASSVGPALAREPRMEPAPAEHSERDGKADRETDRRAKTIDSVIAAAQSYLGLPYRLGREGPDIFDCSGLVYRVFADTGQVKRIGGARLRAAGYMRWFGKRARFVEDVALVDRGDLVVYDAGSHIGIHVGGNKVISALVEGVTLHRIDGITLEISGILKVDWSGEGGAPMPHPDAVAVPTTGGDAEAPASLIPPLPWLAPLPGEAADAITVAGVERVSMRTASSRTFETADGTFITELFSAPVFYAKAAGAEDAAADPKWRPIDLRFTDDDRDGLAVTSAPVKLRAVATDSADGFVRLAAGELALALHVPAALAPRVAPARPVADASGRFADYHRLLRGNVGMRVFPRADGVKTFLVLHERPRRGELALSIDAGELVLTAQDDGTIVLRTAEGVSVGRIPRPLVLDSSDETGSGGGLSGDAAKLSLVTANRARSQLSITLDEAYLADAEYPLYVDLSLVDFPTADYAPRQAFTTSRYPTTALSAYQRPEHPAHAELWHGRMPGTDDYSEAFVGFGDLRATLGSATVKSAALRFYPYWQYDLDGARPTWVSRIAHDWQAAALNWDLRPAVDAELGRFETRVGQWSDIDVTAHVADVLRGVVGDHGFRLHADGGGRGSWKRIVAGADDDPLALAPRIVVEWTGLRPRVEAPSAEADRAIALSWTHPAVAPRATRYQAQLSDDGFATTLLNVTARGADALATTWQLPTDALVEGVEYGFRVRARYGSGAPWSEWSETAIYVHRAPAAVPGAAPLD